MILSGGAVGRRIHGENTSALSDEESYAALPLDSSSEGEITLVLYEPRACLPGHSIERNPKG